MSQNYFCDNTLIIFSIIVIQLISSFIFTKFSKKCFWEHLSVVLIIFLKASCKDGSERQKNAPPLIHWDGILFISPKHEYFLSVIAHFEWSYCSFHFIWSFNAIFWTFKTWNSGEHQAGCKGLPHVSATITPSLSQFVNPSSNIDPFKIFVLKIAVSE